MGHQLTHDTVFSSRINNPQDESRSFRRAGFVLARETIVLREDRRTAICKENSRGGKTQTERGTSRIEAEIAIMVFIYQIAMVQAWPTEFNGFNHKDMDGLHASCPRVLVKSREIPHPQEETQHLRG